MAKDSFDCECLKWIVGLGTSAVCVDVVNVFCVYACVLKCPADCANSPVRLWVGLSDVVGIG